MQKKKTTKSKSTKSTKNKIQSFSAYKQSKAIKNFKVVVFGSSRVKDNDPLYKKIVNLASMLGEEGIDVVTGGGPGLMRAANEGHKIGAVKSKNETHSIGIGVKLPWHQKFNDSVEYKREFNRFSHRLDQFMLLANAVVVAPGGLGTTLELFYTWQLVQVHHICNIPIILIGKHWEGLRKWIKENPLKLNYMDGDDYKLVFFVKNEKEAMKIICDAHESFKLGGKDFCLNYDIYRRK